MLKLKSCPFCGCVKPYLDKSVGMYIWHFVKCPKCFAKSSENRKIEDAAEVRNRRADNG